jgi:putative ABC transport system permease protein
MFIPQFPKTPNRKSQSGGIVDMQTLSLAAYLALKEIWRNKGRFLLISLVTALITLLVLFIAALGEGLGSGNREYLSKLNADLLVYQDKSDYIIGASQINRSQLPSIRQVQDIAEAGQIGFASTKILQPGGATPLKVAMIGVEPGRPGVPPVVQGRTIFSKQALEAIIDRNTALRTNLKVGDNMTIRTTKGNKDQTYDLRVVGITDGRQYSLQPSIFVPLFTWDSIRPGPETKSDNADLASNVIAVKLSNPAEIETVKQRILSSVSGVQVADIAQAIQAVPGYTAQQSTIQTQGFFTMFIGLLVIGGFFQIQMLQKVSQIGVLKAIGASNQLVNTASIMQIVIVTIFGVATGGLFAYLLSLTFPPTIPIVFNGQRSLIAVVALLLIGPIGGYVSIRYASRIEPLKALGLSA